MNSSLLFIPLLFLLVCKFASSTTFVSKDANGHKREYKLMLSKEPIGKGGVGEVYRVDLHNLDDSEGNSVKNPVALKEVKSKHANLNQEIVILKEFAKLEDEQRRHLLKLYQTGQTKKSFGFDTKDAYIMELGKISLIDYLYDNYGKLTNDELQKVAKNIAMAMIDFHRVAMHLDLKTANMMYFGEQNDELVLKAIDFGTSELLGTSHGPENRANQCQNIHYDGGTKGFTCPEIKYRSDNLSWEQSAEHIPKDHKLKLSPKVDIWSIGMILYEAIFAGSDTMEIFYRMRGGRLPVADIIYELNYLYKYPKVQWMRRKGDAVKQKYKKLSIKKYDETQIEQQNLRHYAAYVYLVLKVHLEYPFVYKLINSCLELEPTKRPSAVGIFAYLEGTCKLNPVSTESTAVKPSTPISLDPETIAIIVKSLDDTKNNINFYQMPKDQKNKKKIEQLQRQLKEINNLKDLFLNLAKTQQQTFDLRLSKGEFMKASSNSPINGQQQPQEPHNLCDTKTSELPKYKIEDKTKVVTPPEKQKTKVKPSSLAAKYPKTFGKFMKLLKH